MVSKFFLIQIIYLVLLLDLFTTGHPISPEEEEEHLNNRLKHYLKRIELVAHKGNNKFSDELQSLMENFKHSLAKESFKEKSLLLEHYTKNLELEEYLISEFDKQYINEDILIESWYLNELVTLVDKDLYDEVVMIIRDLKEVYRTEDLELKFNMYADIGDKVSQQFLDYFYGEGPSVPLLDAQLKFYSEYLQYLLEELQEHGEFKEVLTELADKVKNARASDNRENKQQVIDLFDDLTTKFGRYLDEHFVDFKMYKFGE